MAETSRPNHRFHHTMHSVLQHNQMAFKSNKIDLANIPMSLKNVILEQSSTRLREYTPAPVYCRSDTKYASSNTKQLLEQKKKRLEEVYNRGFCADPKELYRPLGDPMLNTEILLYKGLQVDPTSNDRTRQEEDEVIEETHQKVLAKTPKEFKNAPKRYSNGFRNIKEKLVKSNHRINSVKFGVPFTSVCERDNREHIYDYQDDDEKSVSEQQVDWKHLQIDQDRQAFFTHLHLRYEKTNNPESEKVFEKRAHSARRGQENQELPKKGVTTKQIETALGIQKPSTTGDAIDKFFGTREDFYEQRQRLTHMLTDDLNRLDYERKNNFQRKVKIFELSKKAQCADDLNHMRKKAFDQHKSEKRVLLNAHPWYSELMNKVVIMNGVRREVTHYESVLLTRLRRLIEDQVKFKKSYFVQLMRGLPTKEFLKDDIQRIIRFVKQHENISERDYLEAVELAGHAIH